MLSFSGIELVFVQVWHLEKLTEFIESLILLFYSQLSTEETAQLSKDIFIMKVLQLNVYMILSNKNNLY